MKFKSPLILFTSLMFLASCGSDSKLPSQNIVKFSSDTNKAAAVDLAEAVRSIDEFQISSPSPELLRLMQIKDANPKTLKSWLGERVKYAVSSDFNFEKNGFVLDGVPKYEYPNVEVSVAEPTKGEDGYEPAEDGTVTLMANVGTGIYYQGKLEKKLYGINLPGIGKIKINSPRVGFVQMGDARLQGKDIERAKKLWPLLTLFHEGRHSDGHADNVGFPHSICPEGHDFAGYAACDRSLNGAYGIEAELYKNYIEVCDKCTAVEREFLRLSYADILGRIVLEKDEYLDPKPESVQP